MRPSLKEIRAKQAANAVRHYAAILRENPHLAALCKKLSARWIGTYTYAHEAPEIVAPNRFYQRGPSGCLYLMERLAEGAPTRV